MKWVEEALLGVPCSIETAARFEACVRNLHDLARDVMKRSTGGSARVQRETRHIVGLHDARETVKLTSSAGHTCCSIACWRRSSLGRDSSKNLRNSASVSGSMCTRLCPDMELVVSFAASPAPLL